MRFFAVSYFFVLFKHKFFFSEINKFIAKSADLAKAETEENIKDEEENSKDEEEEKKPDEVDAVEVEGKLNQVKIGAEIKDTA